MMMEKLDDSVMDCISGGVTPLAKAAVSKIPAGTLVVRLKDLSTQDLQRYLTGCCPKCGTSGCITQAGNGGDCTKCGVHYSFQ